MTGPHPQPPSTDGDVERLAARARALAEGAPRTVIGLVGPPGAGKSTLTEALVGALGPDTAVLVPMDGFHLSNAVLESLGRRDRKGAPDTFDAAGYAALLRRLRAPGPDVVYAPSFRRDLEEPIAAGVAVPPTVPLVFTEGNYLLLDTPPWHQVRPLLDAAWYLQLDDGVRLARLIRRHIAFGKSPSAARAWAEGSDQRNAAAVTATAHRADLVVQL
ncbi:nucleoside/nucleotide kinase family protein [Streptomyces sp. NPDC048290]|uniref:nucleoside/nucleotide kinase family protein n=1 Tax=Streptomyces sp. NPDC048290 TaxID=3155811 RepID=UPI003415D0C5